MLTIDPSPSDQKEEEKESCNFYFPKNKKIDTRGQKPHHGRY